MIGEFRVIAPIVNTVINAGDQQYTSLIAEDRNAYSFTSAVGFRAYAYIQNDRVDTDVSLLPIPNIRTEHFKTIPDYFQTMTMSTSKGVFAEINYQKSAIKLTYTRSFNKLDEYFAYVGGLIGTILGFIFLMNAYSERAYGVSIARELFLSDNGKPISSDGFHIGYLFSLAFMKIS